MTLTLDFLYSPHAHTTRSAQRGCGAGVAGLVGPVRLAFAAAPQPQTKVNFDVPPGACDCHVHVFGDPKKYPFFSGRTYTPETASADELEQLLAAFVSSASSSCSRACTAPTTRARSTACARLAHRARGVAVIDDKTTDAELDAMGKAGIRGIRLNLATAGINDPAVARQRFENAVARAQKAGLAHSVQHAARRSSKRSARSFSPRRCRSSSITSVARPRRAASTNPASARS